MDIFTRENKFQMLQMSNKHLKIGQEHSIRKMIWPRLKDVENTSIKVRILTGTYLLRGNNFLSCMKRIELSILGVHLMSWSNTS